MFISVSVSFMCKRTQRSDHQKKAFSCKTQKEMVQPDEATSAGPRPVIEYASYREIRQHPTSSPLVSIRALHGTTKGGRRQEKEGEALLFLRSSERTEIILTVFIQKILLCLESFTEKNILVRALSVVLLWWIRIPRMIIAL